MSEQDQDAVIGRLVKERADVRRQLALLREDIRDRGRVLQETGNRLSQSTPDESSLQTGIGMLGQLEASNAISRLKAAVEDCHRLTVRDREINTALKNAGIE
jgi:hypothetical protein